MVAAGTDGGRCENLAPGGSMPVRGPEANVGQALGSSSERLLYKM